MSRIKFCHLPSPTPESRFAVRARSLWTLFDGYLMKQVFRRRSSLQPMLFGMKFWLHFAFCSPLVDGSFVLLSVIFIHQTCLVDDVIGFFRFFSKPKFVLTFFSSRSSIGFDSSPARCFLCRNMLNNFLCLLFAGSLRTSFVSGSTFNVTWHLAYPHRVSRHSTGVAPVTSLHW